jgi:hypothetical protein
LKGQAGPHRLIPGESDSEETDGAVQGHYELVIPFPQGIHRRRKGLDMGEDDQKRDDVLRRMLKTPPKPQKPAVKRKLPEFDSPMPDNDDPEALLEWGKRNLQQED